MLYPVRMERNTGLRKNEEFILGLDVTYRQLDLQRYWKRAQLLTGPGDQRASATRSPTWLVEYPIFPADMLFSLVPVTLTIACSTRRAAFGSPT